MTWFSWQVTSFAVQVASTRKVNLTIMVVAMFAWWVSGSGDRAATTKKINLTFLVHAASWCMDPIGAKCEDNW